MMVCHGEDGNNETLGLRGAVSSVGHAKAVSQSRQAIVLTRRNFGAFNPQPQS